MQFIEPETNTTRTHPSARDDEGGEESDDYEGGGTLLTSGYPRDGEREDIPHGKAFPRGRKGAVRNRDVY
ncbi:hypothetical protein Tco_1047360 [Tanacetum coccineum]